MHASGLIIRTFSSPESAARALARDISRCLEANPRLVLGLPTGRTPIPLYRQLAQWCQDGVVDFSQATTFNLDEFAGQRSGARYREFMQRHLFDAVNLDRRRIHFLNGRAKNVALECERYERQIRRAGGIDILMLGLGTNGHIGFNEPAAELHARSHRTPLSLSTRRANAQLFGGRASLVPTHALSMGIGTILRARRIVLLATGRSKAAAVRRLVEGPVTPRVPASFLQLHPAVEVWVDRAAGARLSALAK